MKEIGEPKYSNTSEGGREKHSYSQTGKEVKRGLLLKKADSLACLMLTERSTGEKKIVVTSLVVQWLSL